MFITHIYTSCTGTHRLHTHPPTRQHTQTHSQPACMHTCTHTAELPTGRAQPLNTGKQVGPVGTRAPGRGQGWVWGHMGTGPVARPDPTPWAGKPTAAAPTWQENILQKVVMTAFADRTVVTIAVRGPPMGCRGTPGERAGLLRLSSAGSLWAHLHPKREPWAVQGKQPGRLARSLDCRIWSVGGFAPTRPLDVLSFSRSQGPPLP